MVVKSEAHCPRCFTKTDFIYPLHYDAANRKFTCSKDASHKFMENEQGFLVPV